MHFLLVAFLMPQLFTFRWRLFRRSKAFVFSSYEEGQLLVIWQRLLIWKVSSGLKVVIFESKRTIFTITKAYRFCLFDAFAISIVKMFALTFIIYFILTFGSQRGIFSCSVTPPCLLKTLFIKKLQYCFAWTNKYAAAMSDCTIKQIHINTTFLTLIGALKHLQIFAALFSSRVGSFKP